MNNVNDYLKLAEKTMQSIDAPLESKDTETRIASAQVYAIMALAAATRDS